MNTIKEKLFKNNPTRMIVFGFLVVIAMGTILLCFPISSQNGQSINVLDALFTATSATCVTGLVVVNTMEQWTVFGKTVIFCLIQIGGLGFMTFIVLGSLALHKKITLSDRLLIKESYNQNNIVGMVKYIQKIIFGTLLIEGIGAIFLAIAFVPIFGLKKGILYGIFHAVSAFCNAGFDIISLESFIPYVDNTLINITIFILVILGGLGFMVWLDTIKVFKLKWTKKWSYRAAIKRLSLHSKIVYISTFLLLAFGMLIFFVWESTNPYTMGHLSLKGKLLASAMQSVTVRTAGFNSIDQGSMTEVSKFVSILLMFVGASPGGTAGGIKTVTLSVLWIAVLSVVRGSKQTHVFKRNISFSTLQKALAVFFISLTMVLLMTLLLSYTERNMAIEHNFMDILFETTSALGTTGITTGITPYLSKVGRIIIIIAMFMGRIGPISIVIALTKKQNQNKYQLQYAEEQIIVG
ncbi:TrkH family potassium uptake protein [Lachnospiraceae bacterium 46-61]